jgi:hypothetical protein
MKESVFTGKYIYDELKTVIDNFKDIGAALEELDGGCNFVAKNVLEKEYQRLSDEMDKISRREYVIRGMN